MYALRLITNQKTIKLSRRTKVHLHKNKHILRVWERSIGREFACHCESVMEFERMN